ncbi:MAG: hypothetical protein EOO07_31500 [Chitinophagaceae bacterium]|nr:MAG: hypothetical protein EOO07_31500 [Chitinophagaceae bacterium]
MKKNFTYLFLLLSFPLVGLAQEIIKPKKGLVDQKLISDQTYQLRWVMLRDTAKIQIGVVDYNVKVAGDKIQVITGVKMKGAPSSWIDTTIVRKADLSPVYHSSYNAQRNMSLKFDKEITGFYLDKADGKSTKIAQTVNAGYFDSNFYPILIAWLPLKTGYTASLDIFDYNPKGKIGLLKANVLGVKEGNYLSKKQGERKTWEVEVSDGISSGSDTKSTYYFDQLTRKLYKQRVNAGGRVMEMELVEQ